MEEAIREYNQALEALMKTVEKVATTNAKVYQEIAEVNGELEKGLADFNYYQLKAKENKKEVQRNYDRQRQTN